MTRFKDSKQHTKIDVCVRKFEAAVEAKCAELQLLSPKELEKLIQNTRKFGEEDQVLILEEVYERRIQVL